MAVENGKEWCRVEEYKGALVLLYRGYNSDKDDYEMVVEVEAGDFVEGAAERGVGRVSARVAGEEEGACSDSNWAKFCGLGEHDTPLYTKLLDRVIETIHAVMKDEE